MTNPKSDFQFYNAFFSEYRQRFIRFATVYVGDEAIAEDIVMDSFVALWEKRAGLATEAYPAYTLAAVKNKCLNHLRSELVHDKVKKNIHSYNYRLLTTRIGTLEACDPSEVFSQETRKLLNEAIDKLPARTREILIRSRFDGQGYKEIAAEMGITVKSVEFEISKAVKSLRIALKDYLPAITLFMFFLR